MANKPYTLSGAPTQDTVEKIDRMLAELYRLLGNGGHEMLSETHTDSKADSEHPKVGRGDIITGQATPQGADRIKWQRLGVGAEDTVLRSDGVDPKWGKVELDADVTNVLPVENGGTGQASLTENAVLLGNGADPIAEVAEPGVAGQVLTHNGPGNPPTWADAAGGGETHEDGYWSPLTDGDEDETELIFADGEAIMVWVPTP